MTTAYSRGKGRLSRTTVTSTRTVGGGAPVSQTRTSDFTYYTSGVYKGLLNTEVIEPDKAAYTLTTTYTYDTWGNKKKATQSGQGVVSRYTESDYSPSLGRYADKTYNSLGHLTQEVIARNSLGQPTEIHGLNGIITYIDYDVMGREIYRSDNTGAWQDTAYNICASGSGCPSGASYFVVTTVAGGGKSTTYYDVLGREMRHTTVAFGGNDIHVDTEYDSLGRVKRKSEPYANGSAASYWTEITYDVLGRVIGTDIPGVNANLGGTGFDTRVAYNGLETVSTNPAGQTKTETKNVLGELVEVEDHLGGQVTYRYDAVGNLRYVTSKRNAADTAGLVTQICYDDLGRKIAMRDLDKGGNAAGVSATCPTDNTQARTGWWLYGYNVFGELMWQIDAKGQRVDNTYDVLGRMVTRTDKRSDNSVENHTRWYYDNTDPDGGTVANALGKVTAIVMSQNTAHEKCSDATTTHCTLYAYDQYGRRVVNGVSLGVNGADGTYTSAVEFDQFGRPQYEYDALVGNVGRSGTKNHYNSFGYLSHVTDVATNDEVYRVVSQNARGQVTEEQLANGASTYYGYDPATGRLLTQRSDIVGLNGFQDNTYTWDDLGNLKSRHNQSGSKNLQESFCYDGLNRLIKTAGGTTTVNCAGLAANDQDVEYDIFGNITRKAGVGAYTYGQNGAGPHAVTHTADGVNYSYDANGNMTSDTAVGNLGGRTLQYTTFDKPYEITKGNHRTAFTYGPERSRWKRTDTNTGTSETTTTLFLGNVERITRSTATTVEWKRYLKGVAIYTLTTDQSYVQQGTTDKKFLYKDHLGSTDIVTDAVGSVVQEMSFDPWGARRSAVDWQNLDLSDIVASASLIDSLKANTTRGFTGHEMLDEVGLVHMNGRVYDARLGRFLQADPFVQFPDATQSLNRYSYVLNNPLNTTDPTGYFNFKKVFAVVVAVVLTVVTYGAASAFFDAAFAASGLFTTTATLSGIGSVTVVSGVAVGAFSGAVAGFVGAFASSFVMTGDIKTAFKSGLRGALTGAITGGFGGHINGIGNIGALERIGVSALGGCVAGKASGGSCSEGAKLAGLSQALKVGLDNLAGDVSSLKTSQGEAVVKPGGKLKAEMLARGEDVDVLNKSIDNTGMGVTVDSKDYEFLIGKPVSEAKRILTHMGKNPSDVLGNLGAMGESGRGMSFLSQNVGGVRSSSVMHDRLVGVTERALGMEETWYGAAFTVGSIPPAFALQYAAFGAYSYDYYYKNIVDE